MSDLENGNIPSDRRYTVIVDCNNCGYYGRVDLFKGTLLKDKECPRCECKEIVRTSAPSSNSKK